MTRPRRHVPAYALLAAQITFPLLAQTPSPEAAPPPPSSASSTVLRTTVRRVVLDVTVTGPHGEKVDDLTRDDFTITEDNTPQKILSFDPHGFEQAMDYTPPKLPPEPPNTFLNLPATPEKGPLYVLLYDLVNMDNLDQQNLTPNQHPDQIRGRAELTKFIHNAPEGARIAIFVRTDGLHLIQGFTSDKAQLLAAIDPNHPGPHIPRVFLMGENEGSGDTRSGIATLGQLATYLDGLPGRKNLIWFSGTFPLAFFATPNINDSPEYIARLKRMTDLLARNQIAVYPVDVRGVVAQNGHGANGITEDGAIVSSGSGSVTTNNAAGGSSGGGNGAGLSLLRSSYFAEDEIAKETGGHAFYGNNDVAGLLQQATEAGSSYYTLTYNPTNHDYNGKVRNVTVKLNRKGYTLAYRHFYYGDPSPTFTAPGRKPSYTLASIADDTATPQRPPNDSLSANMQHGAPVAHQLLFGITVHADGAPTMATPQQMTTLVTNADKFRPNRKGKPLHPVPLQRYNLDFSVFTAQFKTLNPNFRLEVAAAAFDADGEMLNATVSLGTRSTSASSTAKLFRVEQQLDLPTDAAFLRVAVRDPTSDRVGATEIKLPLAPETASASATH